MDIPGRQLTLTVLLMFCLNFFQPTNVDASESSSRSSGSVVNSFEKVSQMTPLKTEDGPDRSISIVGDEFILNGQPLRIMSGSLHYFRLPSQYWRDRLRKLKAAGLNAVSTYVEWSYHEPEERQYMFEGDRDVTEFVRLAAEEGLHVLLRPGPYICAERDLGGLPYWLLSKYPGISLRSIDKDFLRETKIWMAKLFEQMTPLLFANGGPIILVQVENEYGSYGDDKMYMEKVRDIILEHVGTNALLYTTDGTYLSMIRSGSVNGTLTTIDFGVDYGMEVFANLRRRMPHGPLMNSEFYPGWLTHWTEQQQLVATQKVVSTLNMMLRNNVNFNFYMFFGGTNFEFSAGANYGDKYQPDITSYDYDAPLSEAGDPTPKYYAIREAILQYESTLNDIPPPAPSPKGAYGKVTVSKQLNLLSPEGRASLGKTYEDVTSRPLPTFESLRQRSGLLMYETVLQVPNSTIHIGRPRDWIYVYVDGEMQGIISRMFKVHDIQLNNNKDATLSLLVENQGRINYGSALHDYKGILSNVMCNNKVMTATWKITGYPLTMVNVSDGPNQSDINNGPVLYEGYFTLPEGATPLDTFLDTTGWRKGYIWINGYNLGRYWPATGPQITLYVPGVWLLPSPAQNHLQILELDQASMSLDVEFIDYPILNRTQSFYYL